MHRRHRARFRSGALVLVAWLFCQTATAADPGTVRTEEHTLRVRVLVQGLVHPWSLAFLPDGRMLVTEREGRLRIVRDGKLEPQPVSGLPPIAASGQGGLLDVVLHPEVRGDRLDLSLVRSPRSGRSRHRGRTRAPRAGPDRGREDHLPNGAQGERGPPLRQPAGVRQLYEQAQALAALQERQRLARNLHDAVNQSLFSAGLIAEVLPRLWERAPDEGRRSLEDLRRLMRGAQADMRLLLAELRPSTLTDAELGDLLHLLGNAMAGRTNIPISMTVAGEGKLPADVQVALYRLCQEGLNNIAKHAGASQVDIQLQYEMGAVELRIRDDGRGFDPEQAPPGHYGLSMMRERAAAVGARLSITSQPGHGTEIVIRWVETQEQKDGKP